MIEQIIIIALLVQAIHYTMQPDEIFGKLGDWLEDHLPDAIHPSVFACNICMCPWYGSILYWLIPWQYELWQWPVVVIGAMGLNVVFNKLEPDKETKKPDETKEWDIWKWEVDGKANKPYERVIIKKTENEMMPENIIRAYDTVKNTSFLQSRSQFKKEWEELFGYYNTNLGMDQRPLSMGCAPCYQKVLSFIDVKIKEVAK